MFGLEFLAVGAAFALTTWLIIVTALFLSGDDDEED